ERVAGLAGACARAVITRAATIMDSSFRNLPWSVGEGSGPFGKEVRHGDLADDLAGNDQIGGNSLCQDRGGRVRASGRVGTDLELAVDQVDDPVDGDAGPGIVVRVSPRSRDRLLSAT